MTDTLQHQACRTTDSGATRPAKLRIGYDYGRRAKTANTLPILARPHSKEEQGIGLLNELVAVFSRYVILPRGGAEAAALWVIHAHAHDAARISPILAITSPEMRCGKTTMLELLQALTPNAILTSNVTAPALFRLVDKYSPTLLVDEADTFLKNQEQMRNILNSGHRRSSATIVRIDGAGNRALIEHGPPKSSGALATFPKLSATAQWSFGFKENDARTLLNAFGSKTLSTCGNFGRGPRNGL
jgi:hypothetical protein